ncbi:SIR2-like protein [Archangium gephyra]|uniref:DNA gyrase subunit A n=1 Tax=Archangium gephyra TaxID=48 RepID=A0AAC8Q8U0_9BACT|nr:SIR2 family protein [Archangium gephyra]AKJ03190.1 DNA gyrase subunit A [Archangium gephyra]REG22935.1 SIR2-like protein [Archangium gephyra]
MNLPRELVEAVRKHQVVPFVGAGVSMGVKRGLFPSWKQLLEGLAQRLEQEALPETVVAEVRQRIDGGDFLTAAELGFKELGAFRFNRFLRERLRVLRPADAELSVVRALWGLRPEVMLTTNYDDVLLWGREGAEPISNDQDDELHLMDAEASPDAPRLWYLHGTIHRLSTLILGGADYARLYGDGTQQDGRYSHYTNALVRLREWIRAKPFLYVGFSFSDPYVLKQIEHVLGITKGRHVPSFALMKKGSIERGALWPRYNIQLIEYEDHGPPLADCLNALSRAAFGESPARPAMGIPGPASIPARPGSSPAPDSFLLESFLSGPPQAPPPRAAPPASPQPRPVPLESALVPPAPPHVPREALEHVYSRILWTQHRLVLFAPEEGGAESIARRVAEQYGKRVTWLEPPNLPECTEADYCRALAGDTQVTSFDALGEQLRQQAESLGREHLLVLRYEWGPLGHLDTLGKHLRRWLEEPSKVAFHLLVVGGGARGAWLQHNVPKSSVFKDAPHREVPDFTVDEVCLLLEGAGLDGKRWAREVHEATGGHLGLLEEVLAGAGALDRESVTQRLARSPWVRGELQERLREDERNGYSGTRGCRFVLGELLAGRPVNELESLDNHIEEPEVRLYFSGLVRGDEEGRTVLRCRAVELAARELLARKDARP